MSYNTDNTMQQLFQHTSNPPEYVNSLSFTCKQVQNYEVIGLIQLYDELTNAFSSYFAAPPPPRSRNALPWQVSEAITKSGTQSGEPRTADKASKQNVQTLGLRKVKF